MSVVVAREGVARQSSRLTGISRLYYGNYKVVIKL